MIQRRDRIQEPDVVAETALIQIAEVRIQRVVIEGYVLIGIARREPGFLHAHGTIVSVRRKLALLRLQHPVVAVVWRWRRISFSLGITFTANLRLSTNQSCEATAPDAAPG